jgi:hypothetical protein
MAITTKTKHNNSQVKAILGPFGIHYAMLKTKGSNGKFIQWLSKADFTDVVKVLGKFENYEGIIFDKKDIKKVHNVKNGVKERPNRQKPKQKEIKMQRKYGNCWNTEYSFEL